MRFFKEKTREYIISYEILSNKLEQSGVGHSVRSEKERNFNYNTWIKETVEYWNKVWETDDVSIIITNIFENK